MLLVTLTVAETASKIDENLKIQVFGRRFQCFLAKHAKLGVLETNWLYSL